MAHPHDPAVDGRGHTTLSVASILSESAVRHSDNPAVYFNGDAITYRELWDQTRAYAGALRARGIGRGDRVAIMIPNVPDFPRAYYAVLALGAIVVPIHLLLKSEEISRTLRDAGADLLIASATSLGEAAPAAAEAGVPLLTVLLPPDAHGDFARLEVEASAAEPIKRIEPTGPLDAATILFTSGTTGTPKGAVGSHFSIIEQVHSGLIDGLQVQSGDVTFGGLPLFHTFGQTSVLNMAFRAGSAVILMPRFDGDQALELMVKHRATVFVGVPTMYVGLVEAARRTDARPPLRFANSGGAALPVALLEAFEEAYGVPPHEGYGLTETAPTVSVNSVGKPTIPGSVGETLWGVDVAIADPDVEDRIEFIDEEDGLGEIVVRGHNVFKGYVGREEATKEAIVDGWFRTGDLGTYRDGILTIVDRKKDMILRSGYNVYPTEVEAALARHPKVAASAVFGVADDIRGQEIHAAVLPREGTEIDPAEIIEFAREHVASYKYPRVVHIVDELPLGASGKILKRELQRMFDPAKAS
ncbi:AMP-binding protein [Leucobacter aridicollis]|uniref:AMP-binding protein n=1 Tax=Leucobacter aridicollis TaxID=283878 RepID=UPI0021076AA8|nr:AMP-binding protein [Leucobacter aridicollis]UTX52239.1 AMP-binding protein [Leucobacter aridicollis]